MRIFFVIKQKYIRAINYEEKLIKLFNSLCLSLCILFLFESHTSVSGRFIVIEQNW